MKILVDEMPKSAAKCTFGWFDRPWNRWRCKLGDYVPYNCPETCNYLVKGAVACELAVEADGEAEAGKTVRGDRAQMVRAWGVSQR